MTLACRREVTRVAADAAANAAVRRRVATAATAAALALPAIVMAVLGGVRMFRMSLSRDELATEVFASLPFSELLRAVSHVDAVLAPYYAIAHLAFELSPTDVGLRLPSLVAAVATVVATALLARRWWGTTAGFVAGIVVATNPLAVVMAATARPYALATLAVVLAALAADRALGSPRSRVTAWAGYTACVVAAGLLHLFAILAILPLVLLAASHGRRGIGGFAAATGAAGLVLLPFAWMARTQQDQVAWIPAVGPGRAIEILSNLVSAPDRIQIGPADAAAAAIVAGLTIGAAIVALRAPRPGRGLDLARCGYALAATLAPWAVLLAVSAAGTPVLRTAYLAPSVIGLGLLVAGALHLLAGARGAVGAGVASGIAGAAGASRAPRLSRAISVGAGVAVAALVLLAGAGSVADTGTTWRQDDFPGLARAVEASVASGDLLIVVQRYHETGLAAGLARYTGDVPYAAEVSARLPEGAQPLVEARRVIGVDPLRTAPLQAPATDAGAAHLVATRLPFGPDERRALRAVGLECAAQESTITPAEFGGIRFETTGCRRR